MQDLDCYLDAVMEGNDFAFAAWMREAEPTLRETLRRFASVVDTEAVLQESLLKLWQAAPRFVRDGRPNGLLRLGIRIARNTAISEIRKQKRLHYVEQQTLEQEPETIPPVNPPDPMLRRHIEDCKEKLPEQPKRALHARLQAEGSLHDATLAEQLSMQKNTFLQNFTRARKLLLMCLEKHGICLTEELV